MKRINLSTTRISKTRKNNTLIKINTTRINNTTRISKRIKMGKIGRT